MIIVLNGYPGVGKLSIGRALAATLNGRLLDIHTTYNLAFALTEFRSPEFWETVDQVETIAHNLVLKLPLDQPVVLTTVLTTKSAREQNEWGKIAELGRKRPPFCVVHIGCDLDENIRRITSEGRDAKRKPRDPEMAVRNHTAAEPLAGLKERFLLELDTTQMMPDEAAGAISQWCSET
ncbi:MAG: AAA family ATPase [Paracoccaceae bacterium]